MSSRGGEVGESANSGHEESARPVFREFLSPNLNDDMTLRARFSFLALFCIGFLALAGCDSGGSDAPDPSSFTVTLENVGSGAPILKSGAFNTPMGANSPGPLMGGDSYQFSFTAGPNEIPNSGMQLSFATMFIQSNDLYYAFEPGGLSLFDDSGTPIGMNSPTNVTDQVALYDAGTEMDQTPGTGSDQAPRQSGLDTGADGEGMITAVTNMDTADDSLENDGYSYPPVEDVIEVTVTSEQDEDTGSYRFTVTITNVGTTVNGAPIPLSPGSYAVHWAQTPAGEPVTYPGHSVGESASDGIERIAEDGKPAGADDVPGNHVETLAGLTGVTVPLSPGAYAIHSSDAALFETGAAASTGIERIAEDGMPTELVSMLSGTDGIKTIEAFTTPDGAEGPGPLAPGNSYSFSVEAVPGDRLSFATMYIQSNDLYYAFAPNGLALFDENDQPMSGDVTNQVMLYDAGTEGDQESGAGLDQAPRQSGTDTGPDGEGTVTEVTNTDGDSFLENDGLTYKETGSVLRVTITPQN